MSANKKVDDPIRAAYFRGMEAGIRRFAWWKDGSQQVGTCGTSLQQAIVEMDSQPGYPYLHSDWSDDDGTYCVRCGTAKGGKDGQGPPPNATC